MTELELKLKQLSEVERKLHNEWLEELSKVIIPKLPKDIGVLEVLFKDNGTHVTIWTDFENSNVERIAVDNIHVWNFIVNELYVSNRKTVTFGDIDISYKPFDFEQELYDKFNSVYDNEEYKELCKSVRITL